VFKVDRFGHETVLHSFGGSPDGNTPSSSLTLDIWGNLYGTTQSGGSWGSGTVFKLDTRGRETILHSLSGPDGESPGSNLIWDDRGNLYGTTGSGGSSNAGVIFKINPSGNEKVVYNFSGAADGGTPGGLIRDLAGNFYGTTATGASSACIFGGCGVVFKLDRADHYSVLHSFQGSDGSTPYGRLLLQGANLYGTTFFGGDGEEMFGGTIFKLDMTGNETVLYNFTLGNDGGNPYAGLIAGDQGILYGTAAYGGSGNAAACEAGCGVVFELQTALCSNRENLSTPLAPSHVTYQQLPQPGIGKPGLWAAEP
jgi:uncharacterized repeat protein (TIGR03803 family)